MKTKKLVNFHNTRIQSVCDGVVTLCNLDNNKISIIPNASIKEYQGKTITLLIEKEPLKINEIVRGMYIAYNDKNDNRIIGIVSEIPSNENYIHMVVTYNTNLDVLNFYPKIAIELNVFEKASQREIEIIKNELGYKNISLEDDLIPRPVGQININDFVILYSKIDNSIVCGLYNSSYGNTIHLTGAVWINGDVVEMYYSQTLTDVSDWIITRGRFDNYDELLEKDGYRFSFTRQTIEVIRWRAVKGDMYFYINFETEEIDFKFENADSLDDKRYDFGNYYQTDELASKALKRVTNLLIDGTVHHKV